MAKSVFYVLRRGFLLLIIANTIYFTSYLLYYREEFSFPTSYASSSKSKHINVGYQDEEPTVNFATEIRRLFDKVEANVNNKFWLKNTELTNTKISINPRVFFSDSTDDDAWIHKNTLFYDMRVTLSVYLNLIKNRLVEKNSDQAIGEDVPRDDTEPASDASVPVSPTFNEVSVPFSWLDWIDLSFNDKELSTAVEQRRGCDWVQQHTSRRSDRNRLKCIDNQDLSPKELKALGYERHEQLPGFITHGFSIDPATVDVRIAQARSYIMTHLPNPFKLVFLNKHNGTYEVNVDQETPHQRIIKSDLVKKYLIDNNQMTLNGKPPQKIDLDPVVEFRKLKQQVKPTYILPSQDIYKVYATTHTFDPKQSKMLPIAKEAFHYGPETIDEQIQVFEVLEQKESLDYISRSYFDSLKRSKERNTKTEDVYFRQATLWIGHDKINKDKDRGYHYDWRFFVGTLTTYKGWTAEELTLRQEVILDRLARNWFRFAEEKGLVSWIMHGPLLSWYWDGMMFPFDNDLDIQMPSRDLARLGELYNQTLIIEDVEEGFGKYLVDVGTFIHNRDISKKENHIDARLIDVDTGLYIDITGLGTSSAEIPDNFEKDKELLQISKESSDDDVYNDRRKHFYKHGQLTPLKYSMLGGIPVFLPNDITNRLEFEYPEGMGKPEYHNWYYIPKISLWVPRDRLKNAFDDNDFLKLSDNSRDNGKVDDDRLKDLILDMDESQVIQLLEKDDEILCEFYKTKELTDIHEVEKKFLFSVEPQEDKKIKVSDKLLAGKDYDEYNALVAKNIRMTKPLRKSLYSYEYIDQPLHHQEFVEKEEALKSRNIS
ncbi:hypothetical protein PSN45_002664 [Yamadazyma tenuis]|uniref:LicD/FKTN/FKRP nucleotidyltransferase domain-containing protein n=1 Tax=Candida tenuis (strain ATCC 10573 / BCRC 21748 / CBS 615 / JCM 9827 / NBRC 10315 / NRRL Y-1498 / VKM Y-70) TaxID=590646 RepID=G3AX83_CANTC|nr:uncharacterized protein CANTEDRAFT_132971 [Yamadazyma tenuis ATCC 10573]EGV66716.1 hypothetical protein CANTEDRAFT_132971 [Yamadazyma tenuis ATCC 10573]WEJ95151.1 hypothetical protein PSN45_002664 [Yamadazyma tenuis]